MFAYLHDCLLALLSTVVLTRLSTRYCCYHSHRLLIRIQQQSGAKLIVNASRRPPRLGSARPQRGGGWGGALVEDKALHSRVLGFVKCSVLQEPLA